MFKISGFDRVFEELYNNDAMVRLYANEFDIDLNDLLNTLRSSDFYDNPSFTWDDVKESRKIKREQVGVYDSPTKCSEVIIEERVVDLTAKRILSIKTPESLFKKEEIKQQYKALALKWHPDVNGTKEASNVFAHISKLYTAGLDRLSNGIWHIPGKLHLTAIDGTQYNITYKYRKGFELGTMYVGHGILVYTIHKDFKKLSAVGGTIDKTFKFHSKDMETEFRKYLPRIKKTFETSEYYVICIEKTKDMLPLSVVLKYFDGFVPPEHVAWIMSSLHNMLCYLDYTQIVHNDINLDTYFISPEFHSGILLGGWWYSAKHNGSLLSVPTRTYGYMSSKAIVEKKPDSHVDNELARATCRALLGDEGGSKLITDKRIPKPMLNWLRLAGERNRIQDYKTWRKQIISEAFGKVSFTPMYIDIDEAYEKMGDLE